MMKETLYLEMIEQLSDEELLYKEPLFLRIEVSSEEEAREKAKEYESLFEGRSYIKRLHIHKHSPSGNIPCEIKEL